MSDLTTQAAVRTAVFSSAVPAAPTAPTAPAPPAAPLVEPHSHSGLSPSQAATMADWTKQDLAKGKISQADADKIFSDLNTPLEDCVTPADTRTDEQKLIDAHFPAAKPTDYQIRYSNPGQPAPPMTKQLADFDQSARTWLSQAEFPRELDNSLIVNIERVAQQTKAMTPDQLESYGYAEYQKLERAYGSELESKLQAAGRMVDALDKKQPGLKNLLRGHGVGDSALVVAQIIGQSERWHARRRNHR